MPYLRSPLLWLIPIGVCVLVFWRFSIKTLHAFVVSLCKHIDNFVYKRMFDFHSDSNNILTEHEILELRAVRWYLRAFPLFEETNDRLMEAAIYSFLSLWSIKLCNYAFSALWERLHFGLCTVLAAVRSLVPCGGTSSWRECSRQVQAWVRECH